MAIRTPLLMRNMKKKVCCSTKFLYYLDKEVSFEWKIGRRKTLDNDKLGFQIYALLHSAINIF